MDCCSEGHWGGWGANTSTRRTRSRPGGGIGLCEIVPEFILKAFGPMVRLPREAIQIKKMSETNLSQGCAVRSIPRALMPYLTLLTSVSASKGDNLPQAQRARETMVAITGMIARTSMTMS